MPSAVKFIAGTGLTTEIAERSTENTKHRFVGSARKPVIFSLLRSLPQKKQREGAKNAKYGSVFLKFPS